MVVRLKNVVFGILLCLLPILSANLKVSDAGPTQEDPYLAYAEEMPQIQGGLASIMKNIKYPQQAKELGVEGTVYVMAFIDENGNINDAIVIKGIGAGCDGVAVDAIKQAKFSPAKNKGQAVKAKLSLPIKFKLSN